MALVDNLRDEEDSPEPKRARLAAAQSTVAMFALLPDAAIHRVFDFLEPPDVDPVDPRNVLAIEGAGGRLHPAELVPRIIPRGAPNGWRESLSLTCLRLRRYFRCEYVIIWCSPSKLSNVGNILGRFPRVNELMVIFADILPLAADGTPGEEAKTAQYRPIVKLGVVAAGGARGQINFSWIGTLFPNLKNLKVNGGHHVPRTAPNRYRRVNCGRAVVSPGSELVFRMDHLEELEVSNLRATETATVVTVFTGMPKLRVLRFLERCNFWFRGVDAVLSFPVTLQRLQTALLRGEFDRHDFRNFALNRPGLVHLNASTCGPASEISESLVDMAVRLQTIELSVSGAYDTCLSRLIVTMQNLRRLDITIRQSVPAWDDLMLATAGLRNLQYVKYDFHGGVETPTRSGIAFLEAAWNRPVILECEIRLSSLRRPRPDVLNHRVRRCFDENVWEWYWDASVERNTGSVRKVVYVRRN